MSARTLGARRALATLLLAFLGIALAAAAAELGLRLAGVGDVRRGPREAVLAPGVDPELLGLPILTTALELARPGVRGLHEGVLHRTNSAGMRGREVAREVPPGTFRIAVAGDSVTMGHRVVEEDTYSARSERELNAGAGATRFEVLNLGLSGANILHTVKRLERVGLLYAPDLIVYGFTVNDIEGPGFEPNSKSDRERYLGSIGRFAFSPSRLMQVVWPRLVTIRSGLDPQPGSYEYALERGYLNDGPAWGQIAHGLDRLAAIGRAREVCVHVLVHPVIQQLRFAHPFERVYERVARAAKERGLFVTRALEVFRGHDAADLRFDIVDSHPNAEGHRLLAEALLQGLRGLPARCGVPGE